MLAPMVLSLLLTAPALPAEYGQARAGKDDVRPLPTEVDEAAQRAEYSKGAEYSKAAKQREAVKDAGKKDDGEKPQSNPPVPEPTTFALVGAALLMLAFLMRRREAEGDPQS